MNLLSGELNAHELLVRGRRVCYRACGDGGSDGVVLVHGIPTSSYLWRNVLGPLSAALPGWRVVAPDLPGYGGSAPGRLAGPIAQAGFCADFAAVLGLERVVLAGHDFGGLAALCAALRQSGSVPPARARIVGLVLSDTTVFPTIPLVTGLLPASVPGLADALLAWTIRRGRRARALRRQRYLRGLRALLAPATVLSVDGQVAYAAPFADGAGWRQVRRDIRGLARDAPALARALSRLPGMATPVGLVWGEHDPIFPLATASRLRRLMPGSASLQVVGGAGHFVPEDQPYVMAQAIAAFVHRAVAREDMLCCPD